MWRSGKRFLAGWFALGLCLSGCTAQASPAAPTDAPAASPPGSGPAGPGTVASSPAAAPAPSGPAPGAGGIDHIVVIVLENKPVTRILDAQDAPYLNQLARNNALAANYHATTHPSLPNYLALTSGTTAGITNDCTPAASACTANVRNIADAVAASGRSWKMYAEGMSAPCQAVNSGRYAVKHNPFMYYPSVTNDAAYCAGHVVPFSQLDEDLKTAAGLPDFVFITPDMCSDTHDCPVQSGDDWLSGQGTRILRSPAFSTQHSLLVVTWDEGSSDNNQVVTVFAGPAARKGFSSGARYDHYSLLHTIENAWGLEPLTAAVRDAPPMRELLN
jgi:phospholipase C